MAVIYSYPLKATPVGEDRMIISDMGDSKRTKQVRLTDLKTLVNTTYTLTSTVDAINNVADIDLTDSDGAKTTVKLKGGTGITMTQPTANEITIASLNDDANFIFTQSIASATWNITHNLNKFCSVSVVDTANQIVIGDVTYINSNSLTTGITMTQPTANEITIASLNDDANFIFTQSIASATWNITHNLNKFCSVSVVDTANQIVIGDVTYINSNSLTITFSAAFSGKAYLN